MGTGSWGSAFVHLLREGAHPVNFWGNSPDVVAEINSSRTNQKYLPKIRFSDSVTALADPESALENAQLIALAIPAQRLRENLSNWACFVPKDAIVLSLIKGLEHSSGLRASQIINEFLPNPVAVLSGPNLAAEIALGQIAAATVAADEEETAVQVQELCSARNFKLFRSQDLIGVEIAGATKNIIALATGMVIGLGQGENAQAAILTRGLGEMAAIGAAEGGRRETFLGLAGIGDLIATSQSPYSRNRSFGVLLGKGLSISNAKSEIGQTVEAMHSTKPILDLAKSHNLQVPIIEHVSQVLAGDQNAESILEIFDTKIHDIEHY